MCHIYFQIFHGRTDTYHFARCLCSFYSVWSHHSKDLHNGPTLQLTCFSKILLSRHQIVYSREGRASLQGMAHSTRLRFSFYIFCLLPPWSLIGSALWKIGLMPAIDQEFSSIWPSWWLRG